MELLNSKELKPSLNCDVEIHKVSENEFILHQKRLNHQIRLNNFSYQLISIIDGNKSIEMLSKEISETIQQPISKDVVYELLYENLFKKGIIDNNPEAQTRNTSNYLTLKFVLIPKKIVLIASSWFRFMFIGANYFKWTIVFLSIVLLSNTVFYFNSIMSAKTELAINEMTIVCVFLFGFLSCLIHEIGHASALKYYGRNAGDIGVGFYLFSPVFYCDVSEAWFINKNSRVVVNLGGIYFELIIAFILIVISHLTQFKILNWLSFAILLRTILNLNPFLRRDGYWILADLTNMPNLQNDSLRHIRAIFLRLVNKTTEKISFNPFLFIYGLLSFSFIIFFLLFMVILDPSSLLNFPVKFWSILSSVTISNLSFKLLIDLLKTFGLPILFYYLLFKFLFGLVSSRLSKTPRART
ncbi:MAG: hypothetical protein ACK5RG_21320 [Cyclobacteriaceae bacterium]|jgi:putative peptide zinc metalloprotease protein|nr:hypothetical protein [Flammeovirgaceae bacterium]